ncbi:MAG: hypothetical protein AAB229_10050 [Candidatus Hydrogenedentota bacterium]
MSIIHEALKRRDLADRGMPGMQEQSRLNPSGLTVALDRGFRPEPSPSFASGMGSASAPMSQYLPAVIGGGGVLIAALMTYLLTKPGEITVVVPPPAQPVPIAAASISAPSQELSSINPANMNPFRGTVLAPDNEYSFQPIDALPGVPISPLAAPVSPTLAPAAQQPSAVPPSFPGIPVYTGRSNIPPQSVAQPITADLPPTVRVLPSAAPSVLTTPAPAVATAAPSTVLTVPSDLPPEAITIEMTDAKLQSFAGPVTVNGMVPRPEEKLRVGSQIKTSGAGEASVEFSRAHVDLVGTSAAQIRRLERRVGATGMPEEDVTLHVGHGTARTIVRPGGGSVLVSTDAVTATSSNGAFTVSAAQDGTVTIQNEGGVVKLVPSDRPNETYTLRGAERVTYRNGAFIRE